MKCAALSACGALIAVAGWMPAAAETSLPDTFLSRVEALASMQTLNADILASRSATKSLEQWCAGHDLAAPAKVRAEMVKGADKPLSPQQRERLHIAPDEPVRYRSVRLVCGAHVLSEADNWYVPARLTPEMNRLLETTDTPFGKAVAALGFTRQTLSATLVWQPLQPGWESRPAPPEHPERVLVIPPILFEHRAVLYDKEHRPFSEVAEHYTREILAFPQAVQGR